MEAENDGIFTGPADENNFVAMANDVEREALTVGPTSKDSSFWSWISGGRNKIYKVKLDGGAIYEGCLLDGKFHGRGKLRQVCRTIFWENYSSLYSAV